MKVTRNGQVTIPEHIQAEYNLKPGTEVEFVGTGDRVVLCKKTQATDSVKKWIAWAVGAGTGVVTTDEMMKITRGED
jgi:AbrB family looped-hinge helix DNA binding protein